MGGPATPFTLLQVTPRLDAGGVERTTLDVAAAVVRAGGRALVASAGGRMEDELRELGGELVRMPVDRRDPVSLWRNVGRLRDLIRAERPFIVHARSRAPAWSALEAARNEDTPFVTTYAGVYNARSRLKRFYNSVMARGDLVIANSEYTRRHLLAEHRVDPRDVVTIPRGIDLDAFDPERTPRRRREAARAAFGLPVDEARPVFLLAGRLTRWKGQGFLLEAWARARERGLRAALVLAGDDQGRTGYLEELRSRVCALGLGDDVRLSGHLDDMPAAWLAADWAVAPSLEPEAFGRTAVEPQAMGRPVLVSDHGAPTETVEEGVTGWRVAPGDVEAWAQALLRAAALPPEARARMGEAGRARATQRYGLRAMTDATLAAYARLLEERGA